MKRFIVVSMIIGASVVFMSIPQKSHAADHTIGIYTFEAWWEPSFRNQYTDFNTKPVFLAGPIYSVALENGITITGLVLLPLSDGNTSYNVEGSSSGTPYNLHFDTSMTRADFDLTVSYKFIQNLSGFLGFKAILNCLNDSDDTELTVKDTLGNYSVSSGSEWDDKISFGYGPAVGATYTIPLNDFLFISAGTSLLYSRFYVEDLEIAVTGTAIAEGKEVKYNYNAFGNNSTLNFTCYIDSLSTSIILGGRFQVLKYIAADNGPDLANDYFYGFTISALYHI